MLYLYNIANTMVINFGAFRVRVCLLYVNVYIFLISLSLYRNEYTTEQFF